MLRLGLVSLGATALLAAACSAPPGPRGWAPAEPVAVEGREFVLAPHRRQIYAVRTDSSFVQWQFPPSDRNSYPVSEQRTEALVGLIQGLELSGEQEGALVEQAQGLTLSSDATDSLKDNLKAAVGDDRARPIEDVIDATRKTENGALGDVRAFYGELALSSDKGTVYAAAFGGWIFAIDVATGRTRWIIEPGDDLIGGIVADDDTLYFGTRSDQLFAVNADTGEQRWRTQTSGEVWSTPAIAEDAVYVTSMDGVLHRYNKNDGTEVWSFDSAGAGIAGNPVVAGDAVYFGSFDKKLYAVDAAEGTQRWSVSGDNWFWGTPAIGDGVVYAPNLDGRVYAVREEDGERLWAFDAGAPVRSAPALVGDALVVASRDGDIHKVDLESGERVAGPFVTNSTIESNLTVDGGQVLVVPRDATLFIIDPSENLTASSVQLTR